MVQDYFTFTAATGGIVVAFAVADVEDGAGVGIVLDAVKTFVWALELVSFAVAD